MSVVFGAQGFNAFRLHEKIQDEVDVSRFAVTLSAVINVPPSLV